MWHQDDCSETQEAQAVRVHPHRPERKTGRDKTIEKTKEEQETEDRVSYPLNLQRRLNMQRTPPP